MKDATLQDKIKDLEELLEKKRAAIPRHSVRPYQLLEIEELEEDLMELIKRKEISHDSGCTDN
ncbi:MAG TPA: hypothetical protein ENF28_08665 [Proteobacteria bacterium]|nr:hypothetical protein [Pseudomonadota bacterium]